MFESHQVTGWVDLCAAVEAGTLAPEVAASRVVLAGGSVEDGIDLIQRDAATSQGKGRAAIATALVEHRSKCNAMATWYREHGSLPPAGLAVETVNATGRFFDDALRASPHASVAPHSLGSATVLERATDEIVRYLVRGRFLGHRRKTLELGCGNGRMQWAIAPYVMEAAGADVSAEMISAANRRRKGLPAVRFFHAPAHRLEALRDRDYHLVYAVDSFPYVVNAGPEILRMTLAEARRLLRGDGDLLIFKYSTLNDEARDRAELASFGREVGLTVVSSAPHVFLHWDGVVFHLRPVLPT